VAAAASAAVVAAAAVSNLRLSARIQKLF
jgi:hypothetical protein